MLTYKGILKHHQTPILTSSYYQYIKSQSGVLMTLHRTQANRKRITDAPPDGYSSLPGGLSNLKPKIMHKQMNRLATHACPPGGFWAEPRKHENSAYQAENSCNYDRTRHNMVNTINNTRKQLPVPGFLAKFGLVCLSPHQNLPSLCLPPQPLRFQPHHFTLLAPILWKTLAYD